MSTSNSSYYRKYLNIINFLTNEKFRNYKLISKKLKMEEFIKTFMNNQHIKIISKNDKMYIYTFIFNIDSKYIKGLVNFKSLVSSRNLNLQGKKKIILITKKNVNNKIKNHLQQLNIPFENLMLKHFVTDISVGPLVPVYKILNKKEEEEFLKINKIKDKNILPKIFVTDPQMIYRGGVEEIKGKIVEIHNISPETEMNILYRIIIKKPEN